MMIEASDASECVESSTYYDTSLVRGFKCTVFPFGTVTNTEPPFSSSNLELFDVKSILCALREIDPVLI